MSIAGLDLGSRPETVIGVFAWAGATQIAWGLALLAVALRYAALTPLFLALILVERSLLATRWWLLRSDEHGGHHPPEHYTTLVVIPLVALFLFIALRRKA